MSDENSKPTATFDNSLTPLIDYFGNKIRAKFNGICLKQPKLSYTHSTIVNIYIVYELGASGSSDNDPTLKNSLFGAATLIRMLILISTDIQVMELDLIENQIFHFQMADLVNM